MSVDIRRDAPIHTLPPEVLTAIFEVLAGTRILPNITRSWYEIMEANTWLRVTEVCQYWREIALLDPFLWSNILVSAEHLQRYRTRGISPVDLVCEWVRRSQGAPLDISICDIDFIDDRILDVLVAESSRFRSFRVRTIGRHNRLKWFQTSSAPALKSLFLARCYDWGDEQLTTIFGGHVHSLRHLYLEEITDLAGNVFDKLTSLELVDLEYDLTAREDRRIKGILDVVHASPSLKSCIFKQCRYGYGHGPLPAFITSPAPPLNLPVLRRLLFDTCSPAFAALLLHRLVLSRNPIAISIIYADSLIRSFPPRVTSHIRPVLDAVVYTIDFRSHNVHVISPSSVICLRDWQFLESPRNPNFVAELHYATPFLALHELRLSGTSSVALDTALCARLFGSLGQLAKLVIQFGASAEQDTSWLKSLGLGGPVYKGAPFPAPALRTLECLVEEGSHKGLGEPICGMLERRRRGGHRVAHIRILCKSEKAQGAEKAKRVRVPPVVSEVEKGWRAQVRRMQGFVGKAQFEMVAAFPQVPLPDVCKDLSEFANEV